MFFLRCVRLEVAMGCCDGNVLNAIGHEGMEVGRGKKDLDMDLGVML